MLRQAQFLKGIQEVALLVSALKDVRVLADVIRLPCRTGEKLSEAIRYHAWSHVIHSICETDGRAAELLSFLP